MAQSKTGKKAPASEGNGEYRMLRTSDLYGSPTNPRKTYHESEMNELVESVKAHGIINPITVRPNGEHGTFEVIAGNRRYRAAILSGLLEVPAIVRNLTDDQVLEIQIDENLHRANVPPLEEAESFAKLLEIKRITIDELAGRINKSAGYVYRRLKLNQIHPLYTEFVQSGVLPVTTAEIIAAYPHDVQEAIFKKTHYTENNGRVLFLDSRSISNKLRLEACSDLSLAYFPLDRKDLQPGLQACTSCEKNTAVATLLFSENDGTGKCTDKSCWKIKEKVFMALALTEWEAKCKQAKREPLYADIAYFQFDDKKEAMKVLDYEPKVINKNAYTIVKEDTPGAVEVMFVGNNKWDHEVSALSYHTGFILIHQQDERYIGWEERQIMKSDLSDEEKAAKLEELEFERRRAEEERNEARINSKWTNEILTAVAAKKLPDNRTPLKRLWLAHRLIDFNSADMWLNVIGLEASDWKPESFAETVNYDGENDDSAVNTWNDTVQAAWNKMIEEGCEYDSDAYRFWRNLNRKDRSQMVCDLLTQSSDKRIEEMVCNVIASEMIELNTNNGKYENALITMFVDYAESAGVSAYELKPDSLLALLGDNDESEADDDLPFGDDYEGDGFEPED